MYRKLLLVFLAFLFVEGLVAQTSLTGKVIDDKKESVPFANVVVELNGSQITGGTTDFDGKYNIKPVPPGKYTVKASCVGYRTAQIDGVVVKVDKINVCDITVNSTAVDLGVIDVVSYKIPLVDKDQNVQGQVVGAEELKQMVGRGVNAVVTTTAGAYNDGGETVFRGARSSGNVTFVDGVKVIGSASLPKDAIEQVEVITGGTPAKYGDVTGGVTSLTTKGPSPDFHAGLEVLSSKLTDKYDNNVIGWSITGPIYKKTDPNYPDRKNTVLGYFFSGEFSKVKDGRPSAIGTWKAKDDIRDSIIRNPLQKIDGAFGTLLNAELLRDDAFENVDVRLNCGFYSLNLQGKVAYKPARNLDFVFGGTFVHSDATNFSYGSSLFNWERNSQSLYDNWRVYGRMTQKFADSEEDQKSMIKNIYYTIQVDYEKSFGTSQDKRHTDDFFNYGYIGKFTTYKIPSYTRELQLDSVTGLRAHLMDNFFDTLVAFEYSDVNYELSNVTRQYYDFYNNTFMVMNTDLIQTFGGLLNGDAPESVYGLWASPGSSTSGYQISEEDQFRVSAAGSLDIGNHALSFGLEFEQRSSSYYSLAPYGLWTRARGLMNQHISELDFSSPIIHYLKDEFGNYVYSDIDPNSAVFNDTISYPRLYSASNQALFDIKFREHLGLAINSLDWVDIDSYDPSELSINYFSADELLDGGNSYVGYRGYDAWGKKLNYKPSLQDFFSKVDDDYGRLTRPIPSFEPTYGAFYLLDKFGFKDLIFNVGIRIDRYDANQMVLLDNFSLYDMYKVGDNLGNLIGADAIPGNIQSGSAIYVDKIKDPSKILGYRMGSTWYDASGTEVSDPSDIGTTTGMNPYLVNPDVDMTSPNYTVDMSFRDYEPVITVMPRISFSFPISDEANFFAHYDILSTRPGGNDLNPTDYLFMKVKTQGSNILGNPNLKPEKTIDYELGFQQKLNNSSALKLSAFYREMRDMVQAVAIVGAYPVYKYYTYGNIDFGTVKGFSASYDLRRTGNVSFRANYTLQFANGTGSGPTDGFNLINSGQPNLRTTIPLSYDQRHSFQGIVDFRFGEGRAYNGPGGIWEKILQNLGSNLIVKTGSGSPYSKRNVTSSVLEGSINGSRKPWRTSLDMKIDKDMLLSFGKEGSKKVVVLNVYLEIFNLLNAKTVIDVYATTGNPDDNGFLTDAANQNIIESQVDPESYRNYYRMYINNPYNYSVPRTTRIGVQLSF